MQVVSLRLPDQLVRRVDEAAMRLQSETPLLEINRTDTLRYLIQLGLNTLEKEHQKRGKKKL
jgi:metal-responsive CopG/Arc/MetJ family transcriptional regulator